MRGGARKSAHRCRHHAKNSAVQGPGARARSRTNQCACHVSDPGVPTSNREISETELLDGVLAGQQLRRDDPEGSEHREAAVVQLTGPHLSVVLSHPEWVTEIAGFLRWALRPEADFKDARNSKEEHHSQTPSGREHCRKT